MGTKERARPRRSKGTSSNQYVYERRALIVVTVFTLLGLLLWIISISTDYWYYLVAPGAGEGVVLNSTGNKFIRAHGGLWRVCRTRILNGTDEEATKCQYYKFFPSTVEVGRNPMIDHTLLDYTRTQTAFSLITLILMCMGIGFSVYTFREHRYMFKRLAGGVHFLTASTTIVVIEVLVNSVKYASQNLEERIPTGTTWHYGFSYYLAWITFSTLAIACITFLVCSRKRKGNMGRQLDIHTVADEPHILGR